MFRKTHLHVQRTRFLWVVLTGIFWALHFQTGFAAVRDMVPKKPGTDRELIVKFRAGATTEEKTSALRNAARVKSFAGKGRMRAAGAQGVGGINRLEVREGMEVDAELARLRINPAVEYVEPNYPIKLFTSTNELVLPNDFEFSKMYALHNLGSTEWATNADVSAPEAWAFTTGSKGVIVAVVDTGIDYLHDDLKENLWLNQGEIASNGVDDDGNGYVDDVIGYDFVWNDSDPFDDNQHGTHVAGTIGAKGNNGIGTVGVCWDVSLMALKAFDQDGNGTVGDAIAAITYAAENGARIINASWGLNDRSRALEEVTQFAAKAGVLIIAAAGNDRSEDPSYPASFETVLSVAATDAKDERADFSNFGQYVDVAAPGANVLSTLPENGYGYLSGTSMAAPHVSGMAALVLSRFPIYTREELFDILVNSVDAVTVDLPIGNGRINLSRAVQMDQPLPTARLKVSDTVSGFVDVTGDASGTFFSGYSVNIGAGRAPTTWIPLHRSTTAMTNELLCRFDSAVVPDGNAVVQLVVSNANGASAVAIASVRVFNGLITSPLSGDVIGPGKYLVRGTVHGPGKEYDLYYGEGIRPTSWQKIASGGTGKIDEVLGEWDATDLRSGMYALKLEISRNGSRSEFRAPLIYLDRKMKSGWPLYLQTDPDFPITEWRNVRPSDLDGNGRSELVMVDAGTRNRKQQVRVYEYDGLEWWTHELGYDIPPDMPVIGDVNGDGRKEIFVDGTNGIVAFKFDGSILDGWPVVTDTANHGKALGDVDGDGQPELVAYAQEYAATQVLESRQLFVFKNDGTLLRSWMLPWCGFTNDVQKIHPVLVNMDDDPALEIVVPSGCSEVLVLDIQSAEPIWRASVNGKLLSSPVAGDVDGNGSVDIVVAVAATNPGDAAGVYIFDRLGVRWSGWPVLEEFSFTSSPALGDLDRDGRLEIVLVDDALGAALHVVQWDGFEYEGWPKRLFQNTSSRVGITIADVNNDDVPEIVTSVPGYPGLTLQSWDPEYIGGVTARDLSGKVVSLNGGFNDIKSLPFEATGQARYHKAAPTVITDLDGNGQLDFVLTSIQDRTYGTLAKLKGRSSIYAWELRGGGTNVEWAMFGANVANQGVYTLPLSPAPVPTNVTRAIRDRVITLEDRELRIYPTANDWNASGAPLEIVGFTQPTNGTVTLEENNVFVYRPKPDYASMESFTYTIRDVTGERSSASIVVRVKPLNDAPVAQSMELVMNKNSSVTALYGAEDAENSALSFRIGRPPEHGELWNYPNLGIYYPKAGFFGTDSFTYLANDGRSDSLPATVTITILNSNNPPEAVSQNVLTKTNRAVFITPNGTDSDGDPLTYEIVEEPATGTATLVGSQFRYMPPTNYVGEASFTYRAFDGTASSEEATITIGIIATNAAPLARESAATVQPNTSSELRLAGSDPDGDQITFQVLSQPLHGQLSGTPPDMFYLPRTDYLGPDRFEFRVTDGFATSEAATFNIQVARQNRAPEAIDQTVSTRVDVPLRFDLNAIDADGDPVRVIILRGPRSGLVYGTGTNFTYAPKLGTLGTDSFTYKLWDGQKFGNVGRVTVFISTGTEEQPPEFTSIRTINGVVELSLNVNEQRSFRVEGSTNFMNWFVVIPSTGPGVSTFRWQETNTAGEKIFYRAIRE